MTGPLPVRSLLRINLVITCVVSGIISLYLFEESIPHMLLYTVMTAIAIGAIAYSNLFILIYLSANLDTRSKKFRLYRYLLSYLISLAIYLLLSPIFAHYSGRSLSYLHKEFIAIMIISSGLVCSLVLILHRVVILMYRQGKMDLELSQLRTAHAEAANLLLRQQIHPHFLFNALNTLKTLYRKDTREGDAYIVHLANFLRASIFSQGAKLSTVAQELALLLDYFEMQKIRFGTALECTIDIPADVAKEFFLPSFSLQPLLENALKHNDFTEQAPLRVHLFISGDRIRVENNLQKKFITAASTHYGLANLSDRYRLISGDEVLITQNETIFSVSIKLLTHADSDHRG